ncbi:AMP-binding protein [Nocardia sp. CA2R105]|nr:AMP-binding protein [Nocardia coffeae]
MSTDSELLSDILARRAAQEPDRTAYVFLDENGTESAVLSYRDLHRRALAVAAELGARCSPGDRALLIFPQCPEFLVAYFGCLYAGIVAVPLNPPRRNGIPEATRSIVRDCRPAAVLTLAAGVDLLRAQPDPWCPAEHWIGVDLLPAVDTAPIVAAQPDSIAFLQYTSGSTATPKGVMVTHRNLIANEEMIRRSFGHDRDSTLVGWAPFFHDQGLIGNALQPLYVGATGVQMAPTTFIRRPFLWLSAISRYRGHTSGGPNFAFDACVARLAAGAEPEPGLDLSSWQVAFNGAEPIRAQTLSRFAQAFAPYGFRAEALYPCYGLAEATLLAAGSVKGRGARTLEVDPDALAQRRYAPAGERSRTLVASGRAPDGEVLRIVDPDTGQVCPPDRVGEIWVSGDNVAQGYWEREAATAETFRARCADDPGRDFLRTGDLGLLLDEELYVVGRLKDVVIIRGRNIYPQDIELTVQAAHPALRPGGCAAFAVPGAETDRLVVVQELRREHVEGAEPADVLGAIRAAVLREHDLSIGDLVLTLPSRLQKTSSGKIMRAAARRHYLAAEFEIWPQRQESTESQRRAIIVPTWEALNPDFEQTVRAVVLSMPAARHLGFDFGEIAPGRVEIVQPHRPELTQHDGYFQGGVLGSLADFAAGSAAGTLLRPGWVNMTIDYTVKILAPAKGATVVARGRVVNPGALLTVAAAEVFSVEPEGETLCATALVTMRNVKLATA